MRWAPLPVVPVCQRRLAPSVQATTSALDGFAPAAANPFRALLPGERLRCLFAYPVREKRVTSHHDSRVTIRHELLIQIRHEKLVQQRHMKYVRQR